MKFDFFGDRVDQFALNLGEEVTVSFDLESREFNGRWYTDVRAWKAEKGVVAAPVNAAGQQAAPAAGFGDPFGNTAAPAPAATQTFAQSEATDDLPF